MGLPDSYSAANTERGSCNCITTKHLFLHKFKTKESINWNCTQEGKAQMQNVESRSITQTSFSEFHNRGEE